VLFDLDQCTQEVRRMNECDSLAGNVVLGRSAAQQANASVKQLV